MGLCINNVVLNKFSTDPTHGAVKTLNICFSHLYHTMTLQLKLSTVAIAFHFDNFSDTLSV